jgi:hypothetical protein
MQTHLITRAMAALLIVLGLALGSTGASAAGKGEVCGEFIGIPCSKGLWCQHPAGTCMWADGFGVCETVPQICTFLYKPVCGCNGKTYGNDCVRRAARVQLNHPGRCKKAY